MKELPISRGRVALVDDEDYEDLIRHKWCTTSRNYVLRRTKKAENMGGVCIYIHRYIMRCLDSPMEVDHRDGNPLNNQKHNLRICTHPQNGCNLRLSRINRTGFKGVTLTPEGNYSSRIKVRGEMITIGRFPTAELAALAYNAASLKYHGEFGTLNVIPQASSECCSPSTSATA